MRRRLAYELQVRAYGDLTAETRRRLKRLHEAFKADPAYTPLPNFGLKPGTVLTRTWKGALHHVDVLDDGFEYQGERYESLSEIAGRITGTQWSGPLFFGLKDVAEPNVTAKAPLRHLHPQIVGGGARAGLQLPRCPARGLRGLYPEPGP